MTAVADRWADALAAVGLALVDPAGLGGVWLRARHGPVRQAWLEATRSRLPTSTPWRRITASVAPERLIGGLDFSASLSTGRAVMETGVLAGASGGVLVAAMAERLPPATAALVAGAMDAGAVRIEREGFSATLAARFALITLDEGIDDERLPQILAERLAFRIDLEGLSYAACPAPAVEAGAVARARGLLPFVAVPQALTEALATVAPSVRRALFLCRAARAAAALRGSREAETCDAVLAARLVMGPALAADTQTDGGEPEPPPADADADDDRPEAADDAAAGTLAETIVQAAVASMPKGVLDLGGGPRAEDAASAPGRSGSEASGGPRGRAVGAMARPPHPGARIDLLATLRAAAPWQRLRSACPPTPAEGPVLRVRSEDFRYVRRKQERGTTAIFAVDASGSAAASRLAETKGAIELLLSECYVRRDEVALIAFRGAVAETLLEPTRSLTRAKRSLAGLAGGGPTPLAHGIEATTLLAHTLRRRGRETVAVFLTDGRGNIALDGRAGREAAMDDAVAAARRFRAFGLRGVVIDTGARAQAAVGRLAHELGADYVALPRGGPERISAELSARLAR